MFGGGVSRWNSQKTVCAGTMIAANEEKPIVKKGVPRPRLHAIVRKTAAQQQHAGPADCPRPGAPQHQAGVGRNHASRFLHDDLGAEQQTHHGTMHAGS